MSSINFTCDSCGREVFGCTFVNGMKFCAKCYQEIFGETDKDRKITDLEAKLAKSEKERELDNSFWKQECDSLQKTLAEKDKEIECQESMKILAVKNQNLTAIEQLEKVKELLNTDFESTISWIDPYEDGEWLNSMTYNHNNTIKIIDNQIKQLREMK